MAHATNSATQGGREPGRASGLEDPAACCAPRPKASKRLRLTLDSSAPASPPPRENHGDHAAAEGSRGGKTAHGRERVPAPADGTERRHADGKSLGQVPDQAQRPERGASAPPAAQVPVGDAVPEDGARGPREPRADAPVRTLGARLAGAALHGLTSLLDGLPTLDKNVGTQLFYGRGVGGAEPTVHFLRNGTVARRQQCADNNVRLALAEVWSTPLCFDEPNELTLFEQTLRDDVGRALLRLGVRRGARAWNAATTYLQGRCLLGLAWATDGLNTSPAMAGPGPWLRLPRELLGLVLGVPCAACLLGAGLLFVAGLALGSLLGSAAGYLRQLYALFQLPSGTLDELQQALPEAMLKVSEQRYAALLRTHFYQSVAAACVAWHDRELPQTAKGEGWTLAQMLASRPFASYLDDAARCVKLLAGRAGAADNLNLFLLGTEAQRRYYASAPLDGEHLLPLDSADDARRLWPNADLRNEPKAPRHPRRATRLAQPQANVTANVTANPQPQGPMQAEPAVAPPNETPAPRAFDCPWRAIAWYKDAYLDGYGGALAKLGLPHPEGGAGQSAALQDEGLRAIARLGGPSQQSSLLQAKQRLGALVQQLHTQLSRLPPKEWATLDLLEEVRTLVEDARDKEGPVPPAAATA